MVNPPASTTTLPLDAADLPLVRPATPTYAAAEETHRKVEEVVDNLRAGGVDDVGLLTEQQLDNTLPPKPKKPGS